MAFSSLWQRWTGARGFGLLKGFYDLASARSRARSRGLTLVEVMVVVLIMAIVSGGVIAGTGQVASARLKRSATLISGAVRLAFTRASVTSKSVRIVFDLDKNVVWLEEADQPMLLQSNAKSGTGGADPATVAEKEALAESDRILKGPTAPRASFTAVKQYGFTDPETGKGARELGRDIKIKSVETMHDDDPKVTGRAYLYFWPGGQTERASIQLQVAKSIDDDGTLSLLVSPLTGRVTVKHGSVSLERGEGKDGSEREDRTF